MAIQLTQITKESTLNYISSEEAKQITDVVSSISKNYKNIKIKYGIKDKMEKKDEQIDFKAKDVE